MSCKLGLGYSIYNGLELLKGSISQIESEVDLILICWQKVSNIGLESNEIEPFLKKLKTKYHLLEFVPDLSKSTKENERAKHNLMLDYFKSKQCTHFILSATDHYYDKLDFRCAKIKALNYDCTTTKMFTYFKSPEYQLTPIEEYEMLFICRVYDESEFIQMQFPVIVDPALKLNTSRKFYSFKQTEIMMHHYSMVRIDISSKFKNAAASVRWSKELVDTFIYEYESHKVGDAVTYFKGRRTRLVDNYFHLK